MNKKEQRDLQRSWLFVVIAAILGFFVSIAASEFSAIVKQDKEASWYLFLYAVILAWMLIDILSWAFDHAKALQKGSVRELWWKWMTDRCGNYSAKVAITIFFVLTIYGTYKIMP